MSAGTGSDSPQDTNALIDLAARGLVPPSIAFTCRGRRDGVGAQAMAMIAAMTLARLTGRRYLHSPFEHLEHSATTPAEWADRWERFLNLGHGEANVPPDAELTSLRALARDAAALAGRSVVIARGIAYLPRKAASPILEQLRADLRARYWLSDKSHIPLHRAPGGGMTIAIHLRRGDIQSSEQSRQRYVPEELALRAVADVGAVLRPLERPLRFNLYSEGEAADFQRFAEVGCELHLDGDPFAAFHNMVAADILMMGRSSFSLLAGLLSAGIVIPAERRSFKLSQWHRRLRDGRIAKRRLFKAVTAHEPFLRKWYLRLRHRWP